eukprot:5616833-Lingulodinium_polyedra.AAC.1
MHEVPGWDLRGPRHSHRVGGAGGRRKCVAGVVVCVLQVHHRVQDEAEAGPRLLEQEDRGAARVREGHRFRGHDRRGQ